MKQICKLISDYMGVLVLLAAVAALLWPDAFNSIKHLFRHHQITALISLTSPLMRMRGVSRHGGLNPPVSP